MTATVEVVSPGALSTLQDLGRPGWRRHGVPGCGALDAALLRIANVLAGNAEGAAAIEFFVAGPTLKALDEPVQLGFAGDFSLTLVRANGERTQLDSWRSVTLWPGDTLRAGSPRNSRCGVVAVRGLVAPLVLGSASTYMRALLGGYGGRALAAGDKLSASAMPLKAGMVPTEQILRRPRAPERGAMRVVLGPQADHFDAAALASFFGSEYQVSSHQKLIW